MIVGTDNLLEAFDVEPLAFADALFMTSIGLVAAIYALCGVSAFIAMLRRGRITAWCLVGGAAIGVVSGPLVLGKTDYWLLVDGLVINGNSSARWATQVSETRRDEEIEALEATGVSPEAIEEHRARSDRLIEPLREQLVRDELTMLRAQALLVLGLGAIAIGLGTWGSRSRARGDPRDERGWPFAAALGFAFPAILAAVLAQRLLGLGRIEAATVGLLIGTGSAFVGVPLRVNRERQATRNISRSTLVIGLLGLTALGLASPGADPRGAWFSLLVLIPTCACAIGLTLRQACPPSRRFARRLRWSCRIAMLMFVAPLATMFILVRLDLTVLAASWQPAVFTGLLIAFAGDARLLGQWLGWRWRGEPDRPVLQTWIEHQSSGIGYTQILLLLAAMGSGLLDAREHAAAIAGVLLCAFSTELFASRVRNMLDLWRRDRAEDQPRS